MPERIYVSDDNGELEPVNEEPFAQEDVLQALIERHPELLDGEQITPGEPRRWILVKREQGIAERPDEGARWSVDHLLIDQDARPTLVEAKLSSNWEIRRKIVGQMLEYAAHAAQTWTVDEMRRQFEQANEDAADRIATLLETEVEPDVDAFWETVSTNLQARRLRLLFVSDGIPDPLARVVEFLNEQMPGIEVLAVEIKQFTGPAVKTFVPSVIGRLAKSRGRRSVSGRPKLDRESFLDALGPMEHPHRDVAARLLDEAERCGARINWGESSVSIRERHTKILVAWLHTPAGIESSSPRWTKGITFGTPTRDESSDTDGKLRTILQAWVSPGNVRAAGKIDYKGYDGWTIDYDRAVEQVDSLAQRLRALLTELQSS